MERIKLTQGKYAVVDSCLFAQLVAMGPWHAMKARNMFYARCWRTGLLHRVVWMLTHPNTDAPRQLDHVNQNGLDCQINNLRPATNRQNAQNRGVQSNNTSEYKGVCKCKQTGRWYAQIWVDGKYRWLGRHNTKREAAVAYNEAAREYFGEFAVLNAVESIEGV
jgi:hypothetical protein